MAKNQYLLMKKDHEQKINNFSQFFAFSDSQFNEGLKELNTTKENIISTGYGGFIKKDDKDAYIEMFKKMSDEEDILFLDEKVLFDAFYYELGNHEYAYTHEDEDTLNSLGFESWEKLTEFQKVIFEKAKNKYLNSQEW